MVDYNSFDDHTVVVSDGEVPVGESVLTAKFRRAPQRAGSVELLIDGVPAGRADIPFYMRMVSSVGSSIGEDHGSAVSARYQAPFAYSGALHEVVIQLPQRSSRSEQAATAKSEMAKQ